MTIKSFEKTDHPLLAIQGSGARLSELLQLWLNERTEVFSSSVRQILRGAAAHTPADNNGLRVITAPAFLAGLRDYARSWLGSADRNSPDLKNTLLEFLLTPVAGTAEGDSLQAQTHGSKVGNEIDEAAVLAAVAAPWLSDLLVDAARNTYRVSGELANTGVSELVTAALRGAEFQGVLLGATTDQDTRQQALGRLLDACRDVLSRSSDQRMAQWDEIFADIQAIAPPAPLAESLRHYIADRPLESLQQDIIGTSQDARALAEVICLREPGPPLAVGLFGDWGSGKSTFMNMLEVAIDEITARTEQAASAGTAADTAGGDDASPFIHKAVHIRFNAWTYNDANLWASLASEFFQQLRFGGHRRTGQRVYEGLVATVARHVAMAEGNAAEKADDVVNARASARRLTAEIRAIERRREQRESDALATIGKELALAAIEHRGGARETLEALGYATPADAKAQEAFRQRLSHDLATIARAPGQLAATWRIARLLLARTPSGAGKRFWAFAAATVLLVLLGIIWGEPAALLAPLATVAGAIATVWRVAQPILQRMEMHMKELEEKVQADDEELAAKRAQVAREEQKAAAAEADYASAQAEAARFRGGRPEQVLDFFLGESREVIALREELGTVSRVRRAFEELNAIMSAAAAERKRARSAVLTAEEQRMLARFPAGVEAGTAGNAQPLHDFDRIVIYIDDLDRCRADQVVRVLEAVHLLLAFPLFVVVVGVDPRWLMNSLRHFYATELAAGDARDDGEEDLGAVPREYLEKIFQIPVNLRSLTQGADGTFRKLIDSIAGPRETEAPKGALEPSAESAPAPDGRRYEIGPVSLPPAQPEAESLEQTTRRIAMIRDEFDVMTAIGPLAGASPRAVKRLVNVYRFVRGLYRGEQLELFLRGHPQKRPGPRFAAVLFWLALDCGMPSEQVQRLRAAVAEMRPRGHTMADLRLPASARPGLRRPSRIPPAVWSRLDAFWRSIPAQRRDEYAGAFEKIELRLPGIDGFEVIKQTLQETERFSFASLHTETDR